MFKNVMLFIAVTIVLLCVNVTYAADAWLDFNIGSKHISANGYDFNENNYGLGVTRSVSTRLDVTAGTYKNSYRKHSNYLGFIFSVPVTRYLSVGGLAGLVTGYDDTPINAPIAAPIAVPSAYVQLGGYKVTIGYMPSRLFVENGVDVVLWRLSYMVK